MSASDALPRSVLTRKAVVYVRQSTPQQMRNNPESQRRQYDLVDVACGHGFAQVEVVDDDLGLSASGAIARPGFERLVAWLCARDGRVRRRRRRWSEARKRLIVAESYQPGVSVSVVARRHDVNANLVFSWRRGWISGSAEPCLSRNALEA